MRVMQEDMYRRRKPDPLYDALDDDEISSRSRSGDGGYGTSEVDFSSVSLYIPALQIAVALIITCITNSLAAMLSKVFACNAVRTILITSVVGTLCIYNPAKMSYARGVDIMFDALRPSMLVYLISFVCEQLLHSCRPLDEYSHGSVIRLWLFHCGVVVMMSASFWQATHTNVQTDYPFVVTFMTLVVLTIFAPPPDQGLGPLCDAPTLSDTLDRLFRVVTFAWTYITLAYACEPTKHSIGEILLCAARASSASIWILCCHRWLLLFGFIQGIIVVNERLKRYARIHIHDDSTDEYDAMEHNEFMERHSLIPHARHELYSSRLEHSPTRDMEYSTLTSEPNGVIASNGFNGGHSTFQHPNGLMHTHEDDNSVLDLNMLSAVPTTPSSNGHSTKLQQKPSHGANDLVQPNGASRMFGSIRSTPQGLTSISTVHVDRR